MKFDYLRKSKYGYLELTEYKSQQEVDDYFENKYYQNETGTYNLNYSEEEKKFFTRKMQEKEYIIRKYLHPKEKYSLLDVGCGEGRTLLYFKKKGYNVTGIDYSKYAVEHNCPQVLDDFIQGDSKKVLPELVKAGRKYDIICSDMMLDMTQKPELVIQECKKLLSKDGIMWINVSNNYSMLQMKLLMDGKIKKDYWLDKEGHPVYFNTEALRQFGTENELELLDIYGESFIDLNLANDLTNYYENGNVGHNCYEARVYLENLMMDISMEKFVEISRLLGEMGFGRTVTGIFRIK